MASMILPSLPRVSCKDTLLAVIYANMEEARCDKNNSAYVHDAASLSENIEKLQQRIWAYSRQRYLGIFTLTEGDRLSTLATPFTTLHQATRTRHVLTSSTADATALSRQLLELLRANGTTHVFVVGTEVAAIAADAIKHGFRTCVVPSAVRSNLDAGAATQQMKELKCTGVVVSDAVDGFLHDVASLRGGAFRCSCEGEHVDSGTQPAWCEYNKNEFLWRTVVRLRRAVAMVTVSGFEGIWPPSLVARSAERAQGYWRCSDASTDELNEAIDQAGGAGIPIGDALYIASFTKPTTRVNWFTFWSLKEEHERLKEIYARERYALTAEIVALKKEVADLREEHLLLSDED